MSLTDEISPRKFSQTVQRGSQRLENFRNARVLFLKEYAGSYYDKNAGNIGDRAINLIFNAIRVLVPTLVMNNPKTNLATPYLAARQYAELLGLALDEQNKKLGIADVYRRVIVDAIFTLGIMKTGLAQSDDLHVIDGDNGQESLDNGTIYTEAVDFGNFVVDPSSKEYMFKDASFMGDKITVPREMLLASGLYNNDLIEKLPRAGSPHKRDRATDISMRGINPEDNAELQDDVEIFELWVPSANAIITVPAASEVTFDDYLRVAEYYGVKEGPYSLLSLTPPMPGNPLPVPMVGVWYDLHILANRMAKKIIEQAERQKDIVTYKRSSADDAEELKNAGDGTAIALDDPTSVEIKSFGGQQNSNENHLASLESWFNMMAGNPTQVGGQGIDAKSATAANILQQNSGIGLEDMRDAVYKVAAAETRRRAWYLHTDPLIQLPLVKRQPTMQQQVVQGPTGPMWLSAPIMQDVQVILTPEAREGNFLDYNFTIVPESMTRQDSKQRLQQAMAFAQQILPAVMAAAQISMSLGIPFSAKAFLLRMAKDAGIDWMDEVLYDPEFQQQMQMQMMMGPNIEASKGQAGPAQQPNGGLNGAMMQNGQPGQVRGDVPGADQQANAGAQDGANTGQTLLRTGMLNANRPARPVGDPNALF